MVKIRVEEEDGNIATLEAPTDMALNLMEVLKGSGYPVLATCGGMALCATCHVTVKEGYDQVGPPATDDEWAMLDTLYNLTDTSRLACQIKIDDNVDNILVKHLGDQ
ncbi:2Fe-2S iron-sulfur cluster binding domain-containing protein [bacterium]|nr:2Fe-2S iron-sulfur cluster binding domain-containing protein [bacterium]